MVIVAARLYRSALHPAPKPEVMRRNHSPARATSAATDLPGGANGKISHHVERRGLGGALEVGALAGWLRSAPFGGLPRSASASSRNVRLPRPWKPEAWAFSRAAEWRAEVCDRHTGLEPHQLQPRASVAIFLDGQPAIQPVSRSASRSTQPMDSASTSTAAGQQRLTACCRHPQRRGEAPMTWRGRGCSCSCDCGSCDGGSCSWSLWLWMWL